MTVEPADDATSRVTELLADRLGIEVSDPQADLIEAGLVDSLALVTLIIGLEDVFGCQLPLDGFDLDRFRSVHSIVGFVADADLPSAA